MTNHEIEGPQPPNIRLYETLIALAIALILTSLASLTAGLAGYSAGTAAHLLFFTAAFIVYLAGVALHAWRVVGERERCAQILCVRLTQFKHDIKVPLVKFWILF